MNINTWKTSMLLNVGRAIVKQYICSPTMSFKVKHMTANTTVRSKHNTATIITDTHAMTKYTSQSIWIVIETGPSYNKFVKGNCFDGVAAIAL